jgi:adenylate cyclase
VRFPERPHAPTFKNRIKRRARCFILACRGRHVGEVFYGNVGSRERLDFTVIGPAVNEVSRIAAMCRSVDQPVLMSSAFADVDAINRRLVSVGRYALRGVSHPQELFTLDPDA